MPCHSGARWSNRGACFLFSFLSCVLRSTTRVVVAVSLLVGTTAGFIDDAQAQTFDSVVVFGDSLSDSGNWATELGLPEGSAFTTNPDPVWSESVATTFGVSGASSNSGGANYAWGGACVVNPCEEFELQGEMRPVPSLMEQIDAYLGSRSGRADPNGLYVMWGGANDVSYLGDSDSLTRANVEARANAFVRQIRRLQNAGARHVVVLNTPTALLEWTDVANFYQMYNEMLDSGLRSHQDGIVPINTAALFQEITDNPATYGLTSTNLDDAVCGSFDASPDCGPRGSSYTNQYAPGTNQTHLFADEPHPTGAVHAMVANVVTATLTAPVQVSVAGEGGVEVARTHRSTVATERQSELVMNRPDGSFRRYVAGRVSTGKHDALPRLGDTQSDMQVLTLGANYRVDPELYWGAALSLGRHDSEVSNADLDSDIVLGSVHATWRRGGLYLSGGVSMGRASVDIERSIALGPTTRSERGTTDATQTGTEFDAGWVMGEAYNHGPFVGGAWLNQKVDGYRESGNSSTAMNFSDFDVDSSVVRAGYRVAAGSNWGGGGLRPYASIAYERELDDEPVSVTGGSNTMPGRFTLEGYSRPSNSMSASLGISMQLDGQTRVFAGYSGRFGDESLQHHHLSVGLSF